MKTEIHYRVMNGGDGSAYPQFYELEKVADLIEEYEQENYEGWGESSVGSLTVESDGTFIKVLRVEKLEEVIKEFEEELEYDKDNEAVIKLLEDLKALRK